MSVMEKLVFDSKLLPDGHLYCLEELAYKKNIHFEVVVTFEKETNFEASEYAIEAANVNDVSTDFLSEKELNYYLNMESL
ncbi:hypothetical protein KKE26_04490 [bacterium]|nr:hypothetical protein [bacterium]MBU1754174.1 hypothetical protein [bacterium]